MKRIWAEIDLKQLVNNFSRVKDILKPSTKIMGVVKADAYGHGICQVAAQLIEKGVDFLGVATVSEAIELRHTFKKIPILILSEPDSDEAGLIDKHNLTQTVYTLDFVKKLSSASRHCCAVHLKIDTGMSRIGLKPSEVPNFIEKISTYKNITVEGIFTHLACADDLANKLNKEQITIFKKIVEEMRPNLPALKFVHAANSAAVLNFPEAHFDLVRVGIALYKDVLSFKARVAYVKTVAPDTPVSYGLRFVTKRETKIATVSAGYADGYNRLLSNLGKVLINGRAFPIIGTICMDMFMVDVTDSSVKIGDEVVLIGRSDKQQITAQEIADLLHTIDYEVLCNISKRVPRIYK